MTKGCFKRRVSPYKHNLETFGGELIVDPKNGIAYQEHRDKSIPYDNTYLKKIQVKTKKNSINNFRKNLVDKFCPNGMTLDIGCGDMSFLKTIKIGYGYDVIPEVVKALGDTYRDPYEGIPEEVGGITMWDSLEHIPEPKDVLKRIHHEILFVSIPIIDNILKVKRWKHYRPDEHYWYFTHNGFIQYMANQKFECMLISDEETKLGREDITTYVFRRNK